MMEGQGVCFLELKKEDTSCSGQKMMLRKVVWEYWSRTGHATEWKGIEIFDIPYPSKSSIPFHTKKSSIPYSIPFPYSVLYLKNPELHTI